MMHVINDIMEVFIETPVMLNFGTTFVDHNCSKAASEFQVFRKFEHAATWSIKRSSIVLIMSIIKIGNRTVTR